MSRSLPSKRSALTSLFALSAVAGACGHSNATWDAYNAAKDGNLGTGNVGNMAGSGNSGGSSGAPSNLPQFACTSVASQQFDTKYMEHYEETPDVTAAVDEALAAMNPTHQATQMIGIPVGNMDYQDIERSPDVTVPGLGKIRGYNYRDAGHGVNLDAGQHNRPDDLKNYSTVFPTVSVRAASWDLELERRIGAASGDETAASKNNMLLAPCMNIIRHPYWGRTQETYSEDTYHTGRMATAYTVGLQEYVTGCAKHFAANNIEKARSLQNATMNEQTLREIYGRHFEMVIQDGGVGCIMASYNLINGVKSTQNKHLLRDILKAPLSAGGMGFKGLVLSDWWAMPGDQKVPDASVALSDTKEAVEAGLDIEVPWTLHYSEATLAQANQALVKDAARRVLAQKYRFKTAKDTDGWSIKPPVTTLTDGGNGGSILASEDHENLAEESEIKSAVLLANGAPTAPVLPLTAEAAKIAVIGPDQAFSLYSSSVPKTCEDDGSPRACVYKFATDAALGDRGSSRVNGDPARSIGPYAGIQATAGAGRTVTTGNSPTAVGDADTVVVFVGYTPGDEGEEYAIAEGGDRTSLDLPKLPAPSEFADQNAFVNAALSLNKRTIIVVQSGSIVNLPWLAHANKNQATIWAGYGGLRTGPAIGKLIFGAKNFSGKMPMAWPTQAELDLMKFKDSDQTTAMGYFFGYREYDRRKAAGQTVNMVYPFGHGLSYSSYTYSNLVMPCTAPTKDAVFNITVDIKNDSAMWDGDEVALLFVKPPAKPAGITGERPVKELKSFARVSVAKGATVTAQLPLRIQDLRRWEGGADGKWVIDSGEYTVLVGKNADDAETSATKATFTIN